MSKRKKKQNNYTSGENGVGPLLWPRMKVLQHHQEFFDEVPEDDYPDIAAALYLMPLDKLKRLPVREGALLEAGTKFAEQLTGEKVLECGIALIRDMEALEASAFKIEGKEQAREEEGPILPATPSLSA